jgi:hypothetical protein
MQSFLHVANFIKVGRILGAEVKTAVTAVFKDLLPIFLQTITVLKKNLSLGIQLGQHAIFGSALHKKYALNQ